ncbi:histidinol dehydrogenase [Bacillus cereus]
MFDCESKGIIRGQLISAVRKCRCICTGWDSLISFFSINECIAGETRRCEKDCNGNTAEERRIDPHILAAADLAGVDEIYTIGGAQAIAALAYGTESIPKVDKIVGPGNLYVALAKREVYGIVNIDMIAGPSEIVVVADETGNAKYIAADLLSQAEHDERATAICITTNIELAKEVEKEVERQLETLPRSEIARESINRNGAIFIVPSLEEALKLSNEIAPEHLELHIKEPMNALDYVKHAGSIFLGSYAPEPLGDYLAGPNHVLPTSGTARFFLRYQSMIS